MFSVKRVFFFVAGVVVLLFAFHRGRCDIHPMRDDGEKFLHVQFVDTASSKPPSTDKEWIEVVSWSPRVFIYHNFLSDEECEHIIALGRDKLVRSEVVADDTTDDVISEGRTSFGVFLKGDDEVIRRIERKIARWTHIPPNHGEEFYLLRYSIGQEYRPHTDFFTDHKYWGKEGDRIATVLLYLHSPDEGGETIFTDVYHKPTLTVEAKKGNALLFWDYTPGQEQDIKTLHASLPVKQGIKWAATKWLHSDSFAWNPHTPAIDANRVN